MGKVVLEQKNIVKVAFCRISVFGGDCTRPKKIFIGGLVTNICVQGGVGTNNCSYGGVPMPPMKKIFGLVQSPQKAANSAKRHHAYYISE